MTSSRQRLKTLHHANSNAVFRGGSDETSSKLFQSKDVWNRIKQFLNCAIRDDLVGLFWDHVLSFICLHTTSTTQMTSSCLLTHLRPLFQCLQGVWNVFDIHAPPYIYPENELCLGTIRILQMWNTSVHSLTCCSSGDNFLQPYFSAQVLLRD